MRAKRKCELCNNIATIYCESDQANLCYECDSKVHGANFLVSKHTRTLLCHICQSPTLWSGSGPMFGPTISVCPTCLSAKNDAPRGHHNNIINNVRGNGRAVADEDEDEDEDEDDVDDDDDDGDDGFDDGDSDNGDEDGDEHEDDEENQVVPWSYSVSHPR